MERRSAVITKAWYDEVPVFDSSYLDEYWRQRIEPPLKAYQRLLTGDWHAPAEETLEEENERLTRLIKNLSSRIDTLQAAEKLNKAIEATLFGLTKDQAVRLKDLTIAVRTWVDLVEGMFLSKEETEVARTMREAVSEVETYVFPDGIGPVEAVQRMRQILADTA